MSVRVASCSCGQLRAEVRGEPTRVSVCHCHACQRRTGSVFGAQARFPREAVAVEGEGTEFVRVGDEGGRSRFTFCPRCGSTVFYVAEGDEGRIAIPVGSLAHYVRGLGVQLRWQRNRAKVGPSSLETSIGKRCKELRTFELSVKRGARRANGIKELVCPSEPSRTRASRPRRSPSTRSACTLGSPFQTMPSTGAETRPLKRSQPLGAKCSGLPFHTLLG